MQYTSWIVWIRDQRWHWQNSSCFGSIIKQWPTPERTGTSQKNGVISYNFLFPLITIFNCNDGLRPINYRCNIIAIINIIKNINNKVDVMITHPSLSKKLRAETILKDSAKTDNSIEHHLSVWKTVILVSHESCWI